MNKIRNFSIVVSFLGLWITSMFTNELEILFGFILIFTFGIFHGSNDIHLITKFSDEKKSIFSFKVLISYIFIVLSALLLIYILPFITLLVFILFSAFHFGEQQYSNWPISLNDWKTFLYYISYGLVILFMLFVLNAKEVITIVDSISGVLLSESILVYSLIVFAIAYLFGTTYLLLKFKTEWKYLLMELFYILIFLVIFEVSSLIWGFTIYFIFWHSIPSLFEQIVFLYGNFNFKHFILYAKNAFWYWLISLVGIGILYFFFGKSTLFYSILFSFIAAVTFPHTLVINSMFKTKKTQSNS